MSTETPFFIVGSGRSGTTLLRMILCSHSRLHIPSETHFIQSLVARFPLDTPLSPEQVADVVAVILADPRWKYMAMPAEAFRAAAMALPAPKLADVIEPIYRHQLAQAGKARFGDKTPDYIDIIPQLAVLYPGAKFIHLIRDGRDVAMSMIEIGWGHAYHGGRFEWTRAVRRGMAYRDTPYTEQILEVRYEDLVRDVEGTMRRVCAFIGESFEPGMLDWRDKVDPLMPAEWRHIHRKLAQPLSADAIAVWQRKLSAPECFLIEASLHRDLERLGYGLRFAGPLWRPLLVGSGALLRVLAPLLNRLMPYLQRRNYLPRAIYI